MGHLVPLLSSVPAALSAAPLEAWVPAVGRSVRAAVMHQALIQALQKQPKHVVVAANEEKYIYDLDFQPVAVMFM